MVSANDDEFKAVVVQPRRKNLTIEIPVIDEYERQSGGAQLQQRFDPFAENRTIEG
jgi:hypothetical protein